MTPDATRHNADPRYLRSLLQATGLDQVQCAARIGITDRTLRYYLSDIDSAGYRAAPYLVQFALESLAAGAALPPDLGPRHESKTCRIDLSHWRTLSDDDIRSQAPAGAEWAEARVGVEMAVAERYAQLPEYLQGGSIEDGEHWPPEAIEPALFAQVMSAQAALLQGLRLRLGDFSRWLLDDADRPAPALHRLLAAERQRARLQAWDDLGLLREDERWRLLGRAESLIERMKDQVADQARAGYLHLVPWAFGPEQPSPVPLPSSLPTADHAGRERLAQADAEWQAQQLEKRAATWLANAEALRMSHGGPGITVAALRTVLYRLRIHAGGD